MKLSDKSRIHYQFISIELEIYIGKYKDFTKTDDLIHFASILVGIHRVK